MKEVLGLEKKIIQMGRILRAVCLLACLVAAAPVLASPVNVDFSVLGINSVDITAESNPAGQFLDGITFRYDNFGSSTDFASADSSGLFGTTYGALIFDFNAPVTALNFDFSLLGASADVPDALFISLKNSGNDVTNILQPATFVPWDAANPAQGGDAPGSFAYAGAPVDQALMFFSIDAPYFTVANISYESVPEPGSMLLWAGAFMGWRRIRSRR